MPLALKGSYLVKGQPLGGMIDAATAVGMADLADRYGRQEWRFTTRQQVWLLGAGSLRQRRAGDPRPGAPGPGHLKTGPGQPGGPRHRRPAPGRLRLPQRLWPSKASDLGFEGFLRSESDQAKHAWVKVYGCRPGQPELAEVLGSLLLEKLPALLLALVDAFQNSSAPDLASCLRLPEGFTTL